MRKIAFLFLLAFAQLAQAQSDSTKKRFLGLYADVDLVNRCIVTDGARSDRYFRSPVGYVDAYDNVVGTGLNLGFRLVYKNRIGIKYSNTFRYDHVYYTKDALDSNQLWADGQSMEKLLTDYHLSGFFIVGKGWVKHMVEVKYSWMNRGSALPMRFYNDTANHNRQLHSWGNLNYDAVSFHYTCMVKNFNVGVGYYIPSNYRPYLEEIKGFFEFKLGYSFNLLKD